MNRYRIDETIQKQDGTKLFAVNEIVGDLLGCPIVKELYRGTIGDCKKYLKEISEDGGNNED